MITRYQEGSDILLPLRGVSSSETAVQLDDTVWAERPTPVRFMLWVRVYFIGVRCNHFKVSSYVYINSFFGNADDEKVTGQTQYFGMRL
jgi:hypothetical protein